MPRECKKKYFSLCVTQKFNMHLAHLSDSHTATLKLLFCFVYVIFKPIVKKQLSWYRRLKQHDRNWFLHFNSSEHWYLQKFGNLFQLVSCRSIIKVWFVRLADNINKNSKLLIIHLKHCFNSIEWRRPPGTR